MRALLADDEPLLRSELREALALAWPELQICAEVSDGRSALERTLALRPELVFLDIHMPYLDGMAAAQQLRARGYDGEIVFLTAYEQHALAAFSTRAIDYLVKPLEAERLGETVARLKARLARSAGTLIETLHQQLRQAIDQGLAPAQAAASTAWLRVSQGQHTQLLALEDIACLRAVPGYTQLLTRSGEHLSELPLKALLPRLDAQRFVQVHRAAIVNLHFIERIVRERPGHHFIELKHGLGRVDTSRSGIELLRAL